MHEISVLYEAVKSVEKIAKENKVKKIAAMTLEVGELTGYLPVFFEKYYPIVTEDIEVFRDSKLVVRTIPGEALCINCDTLYNVLKNEGCCPVCKSKEKKIISGQDFVVRNFIVAE